MLKRRLPLALLFTTSLIAVDALAAETTTFEEILVTSRKREESLQDVPDAVTVFTAQKIEDAGIKTVKNFADLTPNLNFNTTFRPGEVNITIRGITQAQGAEAPVAVVIDGVQVSHPTFINQELVDVERIEVLRGPQGSLYGRNAIGGAINIVTRQPTNELSGKVQASYGDGDDIRVLGALSGPVVEDKAFFRVSGSYRDFDGLLRNEFLGTLADPYREYIVNGNLLFTPNDRLKIDVRGHFLDSKSGSLSAEVITTAQLDEFKPLFLFRNTDLVDNREIYDFSLKVDYDFDAVTLTSITGYTKVDQNIFGEADFFPVPFLLQDLDLNVEAFTQELRLASNGEGPLRWLIGAFYQDRSVDNFLRVPFDDGTGQSTGVNFITSLDEGKSESWALFGSASYDITAALELTLGLRYEEDKRTSVDAAAAGSDAGETFKQLQPKVQLSYDWTENLQTYATYGRGFSSGGFNAFFAVGSPDRGYDKMVSDNFEIGMKGTFLEGQLIVNAAVFHIELDNQQLFFISVDPPSQNVTNIEKSHIDGAELEIVARPTDRLDINLGIGIADAVIDDFDGSGSFKNNKSPQNPEYTFNVSAQYRFPITDGMDLRAYASYLRRGGIYWDPENTLKTPSKNIVNLRLFLETDQWSIGGYVDNLTDARYPTQVSANAYGPDAHVRISSPKRMYGVQGTFRF